MKRAAVLLMLISLCASCARTTVDAKPQATTQPSLSQIDYGEEEFRQVSTEDEIISTLRNGLVVILKRVPSPVCAVRAYARTGGVYEGQWLGGGLSHLLEHLVAGCSNERRTEEQNRNLLQAIGNNSNAYTDYDHTAFYVNTTPEHLDEAVDLVAGWMFTCKIAPAEYRREYEVVQRELEKDKGEPEIVFSELTFSNRYRVNPARVPVIGYQEVIQGLSRDDVYSYYKLAYQTNNIVVAVAGDLPPEQMLKAVQKQVREFKPGRAFSHDIDSEPEVTGPRTVVATFPNLGSSQLELAYPSVKLDHPDVYALDLLATILGGGESSILVEELRDKRQLVDSVEASDYTPTYAEGTFMIDMSVDPEKLHAATDAALEILEKIKLSGIDEQRLSRAKTQMRVAHVREHQTTEEIISGMATDYLATGDAHFMDRYIERIERLNSQQVQDVARRYFVRDKLLTTALVSTEGPRAAGLPTAEAALRSAAPTTRPTASPTGTSKIAKIQLGNGNVLLHRQIKTSPLVTIKVYALGGLTAEDATTNGLGNLTMEMLTRGTKTRSATELAESLDAIGAELETSCGTNVWSWSASCLKKDFPKAIELIEDVIAHPAFAEDEFKSVQERVLAEIEAQDADWFAQGMRYFKKEYFGYHGSPYGWQTIGTAKNVEAFTTKDCEKWYREKICDQRRIIAIFGDVDPDSAARAADRIAASVRPAGYNVPSGARPSEPDHTPSTTIPSDGPRSLRITRFEVQQTHQPLAGVFIGFATQSTFQMPQRFAITVADCMTSGYGGPTGYLFDDLRGRGLVYQTDAQDIPGRDAALPGVFVAYAGCDPSKVNEVIDVMLLNIARLQGTPSDVQPDWFERSKQLIITQDATDYETPEAQATGAALDELYGRGYDAHDKFADNINKVSLDEVRNVARTLLHNCVITVSTPKPDLVKKFPGLRTYDHFPPVDLTPRGVQHDTK